MFTRRGFLGRGLGAVAIGILGGRGHAPRLRSGAKIPDFGNADTGIWAHRPINPLPGALESVMVRGYPFAKRWTGDGFDDGAIPFHSCHNCFGDEGPPAPTEEIDIAVVGGGMSGLSTAYLLYEHRPVLFELRDRFGGVAQGESWEGVSYSLGNAYIITPDPGTFLEELYLKLGLDRVVRVHDQKDLMELNGAILDDFWDGLSEDDRLAFERYAEIVTYMGEEEYPDIPLPEGEDNEWIYALDRKSFKQDVEERMDMPIPPLLAMGIQAYFYSSFNAGWEEVSAASGWNFVAAEEFGRWVFPGGTTYMTDAMWRRLVRMEALHGDLMNPRFLRANTMVVDVRMAEGGRVQVTYIDAGGQVRSLLARRVVICCSKRVAKMMMRDMRSYDPQKRDAIDDLDYRGYVVANLLLHHPIDPDYYDIFMLGAGDLAMTGANFEADSRVVDMLNGGYARLSQTSGDVLTLYWPLPFAASRVSLVRSTAWRDYARNLVPQLDRMLGILGIDRQAVRQVRMTRWGHAMPHARPNLIADGTAEFLRRPIDGKIFFVHQDNWALPAVENCVLDAHAFVPQIIEGL